MKFKKKARDMSFFKKYFSLVASDQRVKSIVLFLPQLIEKISSRNDHDPLLLRKFINRVVVINPIYYIVFFVILQAYLYFQPYIHTTGASYFYLQADPSLFARDIIRTSTVGDSLFYDVMYWMLGSNLTNPYCLFFPYLMSCGLIALAVVLTGTEISGGKREIGLLMLIMLVVQKSPIQGSYVSLIYADYHYQHFTLPIVLLAVFFLFREQFFLSALFLVVSFYCHVKTAAAITLALSPIFILEVIKKPKIILSLIVPAILLIPEIISLTNSQYLKTGLSLTERNYFLQLMIDRESNEGSMYFDEMSIVNLITFVLFSIPGILTIRYVANESLRKKLYLCHAGVYLSFGIGILVRIVNHYWGPLGAIVILGYPRASILGVFLTLATVAVFFYKKIEKNFDALPFLFWTVFFLFAVSLQDYFFYDFAYVPKTIFGLKLIIKLFVALFIAGFVVFILKRQKPKLNIKQTIVILFVLTIVYVLLKLPSMVYRSYQSKYPYFPLIPVVGFFDREMYDAGQWAQKNTQKGDLFLAANGDGQAKGDLCDGRFRNHSLRSVWCQNVNGTYGDTVAMREWARRQNLLDVYMKMPFVEWEPLLKQERVDYIFSSKFIQWPKNCVKVFENSSYIIYKIVP